MMKRTFLALGCVLLLIGCASNDAIDSSEIDAYPSSYNDSTDSYNLPYKSNVYIPTSRAKNKAAVQLPKASAPKTVRALPSPYTPAKTKAATVKQPAKKTAKSLPVLDSGTLSKLKAKPLATPTKAAKPVAQCPTVVKYKYKYKYITKVVTKNPGKKVAQKPKKAAKSKSKKK